MTKNSKVQKHKAKKAEHSTDNAKAEDVALAAKITEAVKAVDAAVATQVERAKAAGLLLHDAHKRHPGRKAFEAFLKLTDGVQYSRAMELIGVALDRKTYEQLQADNAARQQKSRDKKKSSPKPEPKALPKQPEPVRDVTDDDDPEAGAERRKAEFAALDAPPTVPLDEPKPTDQRSAAALAEFEDAVDRLFPQMSSEDLTHAYVYATRRHDDLSHDMMRKAS